MSEQKLSEEFSAILDWLIADEHGTLMDGPRPTVHLMKKKLQYFEPKLAALEAKLSEMEEALEHCGYDPTDCIDCGGPPHNEWCRFWKLRDALPILFAAAEEEA